MVYPPVYSPETQTRPPRALPVPEPKKSKFGLFKRKDKEPSAAPRSSADSDTARVYPDPSTQGAMQPRPGMDNRYPAYPTQPTTDPYGRPVMPDGSTVPAQPEMQPRPGVDSRYPVYTTQPAAPYAGAAMPGDVRTPMPGEVAVPPSYPATDPSASTLPPLPDTRTTQPTYPQLTPAPAPAPNPSGALAQVPSGPAMPPSDAPIFRREPVLEPAPAPAPTTSASNAPIFRSGGQAASVGMTEAPIAGNSTARSPQWEYAAQGGTSVGSNASTTLPPARTETPAPPKPDEFANLPFAKPVPGKVGFVTLSTYSAEIDVRGIAPGTPVEIPDPRDASKTIQFRVP